MEGRFRIGTSGWIYKHWRGVFYPEGLAQGKWLEHYGLRFDTVECNATFYRLPQEKTFSNWKERTPEGFCWTLKAPRVITHYRKLRDVAEPLKNFLLRARLLGAKLGPVLFQLPPNLHYDAGLFDDFAALLGEVRLPVVEVRHGSWLCDRFFSQLQARSIAFCISDTAGRYPYHEAVTAPFVYIRLHGSRKLYASRYTESELDRWAEKILGWNLPTYVYFDNDFEGHAVMNAQELKARLGR
ncbi:MAG: DUF72 domain-containing protein [Bacteroidetes bacterium]|nr:MAG: DUF72 domain-containing protein [Bacteroidota bacterium]